MPFAFVQFQCARFGRIVLLEVNDMEKMALVIGATGGAGGETARALLARGWKVRALHRRPEEAAKGEVDPRIEWVKGDAMDAASVIAAARGVSAIVHGANPPG